MEFPIFQVDAFTGHLFGGNPAAVVILPQWFPEETLQSIAAENNLAETAFVVPIQGAFQLRWFTPKVEVDLCGHATLASAYVLFNHGYASLPEIVFRYQGGTFTVVREGELLAMRFPSRPPHRAQCDAAIVEALANARDLRKISPVGRNDNQSFFARLASLRLGSGHAWRDKLSEVILSNISSAYQKNSIIPSLVKRNCLCADAGKIVI